MLSSLLIHPIREAMEPHMGYSRDSIGTKKALLLEANPTSKLKEFMVPVSMVALLRSDRQNKKEASLQSSKMKSLKLKAQLLAHTLVLEDLKSIKTLAISLTGLGESYQVSGTQISLTTTIHYSTKIKAKVSRNRSKEICSVKALECHSTTQRRRRFLDLELIAPNLSGPPLQHTVKQQQGQLSSTDSEMNNLTKGS